MIKIIAVDDDKAYLEFLSSVVFTSADREFQLSACISNMEGKHNIDFMLQKIKDLQPDVVLMDLSFALVGKPNDYGIELVLKIQEQFPSQKIIMLVGDQDESDPDRANKIVRSFQAGAAAYLGKREIVNYREAIREVIHGDKYISGETSRILVRGITSESNDARKKYKLSDRQIEVLYYLSQDLDIGQVAQKMVNNDNGTTITPYTVNFHLRNIRRILIGEAKGGTLHGLIAKALREKIIE